MPIKKDTIPDSGHLLRSCHGLLRVCFGAEQPRRPAQGETSLASGRGDRLGAQAREGWAVPK
eukprot:9802922-Alexandrium_andersonii.AAC.1